MLSGDVQDVVYYSWQIVESHFVQPKDFSLFSFVLFIKRVNLREFPVLRVFFRVESLVFVWVDVASHVGQPYVITSVCHYIRCKLFFEQNSLNMTGVWTYVGHVQVHETETRLKRPAIHAETKLQVFCFWTASLRVFPLVFYAKSGYIHPLTLPHDPQKGNRLS